MSLLGNGVATVLFPLFVLTRTGDIFAAGIIASVTAATGVVAGLLGGVVVDRVNRRNLSAFADILSGLSIGLLALADLFGFVTLPVLIGISVLGAFADVPGMTARETLLPALAGSRSASLDRLVAVRETLAAAMILVGPAVGAVLVSLLGIDARVFWVTGVMSVVAALLTLGLTRDLGDTTPMVAESRPTMREVTAGLRSVFTHPIIRASTIVGMVIAAAMAVLQTTVIPAYFTGSDKSVGGDMPQMVGYVVSAIALGSMIGGIIYATYGSRAQRRLWLNIGMIGTGVSFLALGALVSPWFILVMGIAVGIIGAPASAVLGVATIDAAEPSALGRVLGAQNAILLGGPALLGAPMGAFAEHFGLRVAGITLGCLVLAAALWATTGRSFRSIDGLPKQGEGEEHELEHQRAI